MTGVHNSPHQGRQAVSSHQRHLRETESILRLAVVYGQVGQPGQCLGAQCPVVSLGCTADREPKAPLGVSMRTSIETHAAGDIGQRGNSREELASDRLLRKAAVELVSRDRQLGDDGAGRQATTQCVILTGKHPSQVPDFVNLYLTNPALATGGSGGCKITKRVGEGQANDRAGQHT